MLRTVLTSGDPPLALRLATAWQAAGDAVTVVLLDAASAIARPGHSDGDAVGQALAAGVRVTAELDALGRRGLGTADVTEGVEVVDLDEVTDLLVIRGCRAVWL